MVLTVHLEAFTHRAGFGVINIVGDRDVEDDHTVFQSCRIP